MSDGETISDKVGAQPVGWRIVPTSFFSRHLELFRGDERVTRLRRNFLGESCQFSVAGRMFSMNRKSIWKDGFLLMCGDDVVCDVKRNFWSRRFEISAAGEVWLLQPAGWFTTAYHLLFRERIVGVIRLAGWFTRKRIAEFSQEVPIPVQIVAIYLQIIVSIRQQNDAAN